MLPLHISTGPWFRLRRLAHEPLFFGRLRRYRFDAPQGEYGVLYCAGDISGAFVETFGRAGTSGLLDWAELQQYGVARIEPALRCT